MSASYPYAYNMAPTYDESPEVATNSALPEVYHHPQQTHQAPWSPQQSTAGSTTFAAPSSTFKPEDQQQQHVAYQTGPGSTASGNKRRGGICGCTTIVFVLSVIIAILSAAVIGLAAGTGVAASNYNDANSKLEAMSSSYSSLQNAAATGTTTATASGASSTSTSYSNITNGCSDEDGIGNEDTYTPSFFNKPNFTMYCNRDALNTPFYSLFTADFDGCMDACASWNSYNNTNSTCEGVSFIPLWSIMEFAVEGEAPGDCYLKPGPQSKKGLNVPNIGTECHAAILDT